MESKECTIPIHRPNLKEMFFFFICGVIMSVPITLFISSLADPLLSGLAPFLSLLVSVAFLAPFIEEFSKIFPLYYRHGETQRSIMNLALAVGFGFGLVEMILYLAAGAGIPERLPGVVFHPASASISAYGIATKRPVPFYLLAVGLHFSNNFLDEISPFPLSTSVIIVAITVWIAWSLHRKTKETIIRTA